MSNIPLMPMATAVWLVENTTLTFKQIASFCNMHEVEIQGIADGEVAKGIVGYNPIMSGQLTREEINLSSNDESRPLNIKTYKYDIDNEEYQLILSDNIKSNELETIVSSLTTLKFTNFYTGHLEFNLEYIEDNKEKSKPYKINLLGKYAVLELEKPLSLKTKSYFKNIKIEGYYFDSDADNRCETTLVVKNNISSLIIDTYDMTDEFCI